MAINYQQKTLNYLRDAERELDRVRSTIRSAQSYADINHIHSMLSSADSETRRVERAIDDATRIVRDRWGDEE